MTIVHENLKAYRECDQCGVHSPEVQELLMQHDEFDEVTGWGHRMHKTYGSKPIKVTNQDLCPACFADKLAPAAPTDALVDAMVGHRFWAPYPLRIGIRPVNVVGPVGALRVRVRDLTDPANPSELVVFESDLYLTWEQARAAVLELYQIVATNAQNAVEKAAYELAIAERLPRSAPQS